MRSTDLHKAIATRDMDTLKRIVASGKDISGPITERGMTPLSHALTWNQGLKYLLKHGADVNYVGSEFKTTPLMYAAMWEHLKATQILIEAGADVNVKSENDFTALWSGCSNDTKTREKIAFMLLDAGADVHGGKTRPVISIAAGSSTPKVLQRLIDEGADVNAQNDLEVCPIYMALVENKKKNLQILLDAGADPFVVVKRSKILSLDAQFPKHFGKNMIEVAQIIGSRVMTKMLEEAAAKMK